MTEYAKLVMLQQGSIIGLVWGAIDEYSISLFEHSSVKRCEETKSSVNAVYNGVLFLRLILNFGFLLNRFLILKELRQL